MDTSETGLEKIIVDWLVQHNGYEQETRFRQCRPQWRQASGTDNFQ